ncbi:MAG TPA: DNA-processing protein DprA [Halothiobacillus sp.]|nr:MAG: DNA protecting protein DprA [Halothiobacillus sp. 20-54-6]HQT44052.1 DNA-processing protein DprA [Halothiobacillus sp.]
MATLLTPDPLERRALLFLITINGMGPKRLRRLLDAYESNQAALAASAADWERLGLPASLARQNPRGDAARVQIMLDWLEQDNQHHLLTTTDAAYPELLKTLPDAPAALFGRGDIRLLQEPQLAIVGSRSPTGGGLNNARAFARHLSTQGFVITSGLALGIDAAAHRGALAAGGATIAVMGTGPDVIYPREHAALSEEIVQAGGLLVSEWPPGTTARKEHFPRRNRLISGMAEGVLVVEASLQSGSLITARLAAEQGREVFAIPGSIHNPLSRGAHRLIRDGAKLVETGQDIFEELAASLGARLRQAPPDAPLNDTEIQDTNTDLTLPGLDPAQQQLLDRLGFDPQSADALIAASGLTPAAVSSILLMLELAGYVTTLPGGLYSRTA